MNKTKRRIWKKISEKYFKKLVKILEVALVEESICVSVCVILILIESVNCFLDEQFSVVEMI